MKVTILRGVPGSGKSTYCSKNYPGAAVFSADDFFMVDGVYVFDSKKLPQAHGQCLRYFVEHVQRGPVMPAVVDNTNTAVMEIAPYAALALAYGWELEIVTISCNPEVAAARNSHGVPLTGVMAMHKRLMEAQLPPWWPHRIVESGS